MQKFVVTGGVPLHGEVRIAGAKNAVLKLMAAAALSDEPSVLRNVPKISDVMIMRETMGDIGFDVRRVEGDALRITAREADWLFVPLEAAMKMRASFILLGPLLARFGRVIISNPGGDRIGRRPVNLHVHAMERLGAEIEYKNGYYFAKAPSSGLRGARIEFPYVTVMGTENALLAAVLARGTTVIENAAREPETDDLVGMLRAMGAQIERTAPHRLEVQGVDALHGTEHRVIGDRLEAGTFAIAAAVTGGSVSMHGVDPQHLGAFLDVLGRMGVPYEKTDDGLRVSSAPSYAPVDVETAPYPGFATDLQAPLAVLMTQADGDSRIHETIYEDRLDYVIELVKMGAVIEVIDERHACIAGPTPLHGREVSIADLRAGATLVLAALAASETSVISGVEHVDRGYEQIEAKLVQLGAQIHRIDA
ncbi:MAG TPA: UDP-N-acetylglucosamine 1-carboxyvinyltransferase [candidate division Zixibacteria bacterium]|nr:UDP-N-acetylglucosamine 1-carboxyvinyltransferase [candidate division Zixibacteria bacterium]